MAGLFWRAHVPPLANDDSRSHERSWDIRRNCPLGALPRCMYAMVRQVAAERVVERRGHQHGAGRRQRRSEADVRVARARWMIEFKQARRERRTARLLALLRIPDPDFSSSPSSSQLLAPLDSFLARIPMQAANMPYMQCGVSTRGRQAGPPARCKASLPALPGLLVRDASLGMDWPWSAGFHRTCKECFTSRLVLLAF